MSRKGGTATSSFRSALAGENDHPLYHARLPQGKSPFAGMGAEIPPVFGPVLDLNQMTVFRRLHGQQARLSGGSAPW
jgi:hypothetical protein